MKITVSSLARTDLEVDAFVAPVFEDQDVASTWLSSYNDDRLTLAVHDLGGKIGATGLVYPTSGRAKRMVLVGAGTAADADQERFRRIGAEAAQVVKRLNVQTAGVALPELASLRAGAMSQAFVEGFILAQYAYQRYKTQPESPLSLERLIVHTEQSSAAVRGGVERGRVLAEAVGTARDWVNRSPNEKTASMLAGYIEEAGERWGYETWIWDKEQIVEENMGGLLAVNLGSVEPPTFSILTWKPENPLNQRPLVLVGKGVVYDTGGLSLKDTKGSMDQMKMDMAGAATVIGTMEAVARLNLPLHVIGLIPATDNRPGVNAYVPGDVIRMHSGATVEVLNTDAEGRMLLADALSYAKRYRPELVIDVATLTGAVIIALGMNVAGLMANSTARAREAAEQLVTLGASTGERVHALPMFDSYAEQLKSDVADLKNVGGRPAGTITAAKFLEHFVDYPWIHLDIAGTAYTDKASPYQPKGGTGFGVRLLTAFLQQYGRVKRSN